MPDPHLADEIQAACAVFQKDVGVWDADMEIYPSPGAEPFKHKAVVEARLIAGGKWLLADHKADSGFEGHGIYGWDPSKKKYCAAWVDSMQGAISRGEGGWDEAARTMTFQMALEHQGRTLTYTERTVTLEDGLKAYTNSVPLPDGKEFVMVKVTYKRRKGS